MGGQNGGRQALTFNDWQHDLEKRQLSQERRPVIRSAADLMGPGLGPTAVQLVDWNDDATAFNGLYFSEPGALNGPDSTSYWMGTVEVTEDGVGFQRVRRYIVSGDDVLEEWGRVFADPGTGARDYSAWQLWSDRTPLGDPVMSWSETPPNDRYRFANGSSLAIVDFPDLFARYGTVNGAVDSDHFNLPDMRGRFPQGSHAALARPPGNVDTLDPDARLAGHSHQIDPSRDHSHDAGTLENAIASDRMAGSLPRATIDISGRTGPDGIHDHGARTGQLTTDEFPHFRWAYHVRVLL